MTSGSKTLEMLGRGLLSLCFVIKAVDWLKDWQGAEEKIGSVIQEGMGLMQKASFLPSSLRSIGDTLGEFLLSFTHLWLLLALLLVLLASTLLLLNVKTRLAALILLLFAIGGLYEDLQPVLHAAQEIEWDTLPFFKNAGVLSGLFLIMSK